jgi:hypothetical protein
MSSLVFGNPVYCVQTHLDTRVWPAIEIPLYEVSKSSTLFGVLGCGYEVLDMENEVIFSLGNWLISPHVVEKSQMMAWWRLTKCTDLRILKQKFNYLSSANFYLIC